MAQFSYFLIRYVPDLARGEFVNIGVLVRDMSEGQPPVLRFTNDWTRLLSFDQDADVEMLQSLEEELRINLAKKPQDGTQLVIDTILESFSNSLQISDGKGCTAESIDLLVEHLLSLYVLPPAKSNLFAVAVGSRSGR